MTAQRSRWLYRASVAATLGVWLALAIGGPADIVSLQFDGTPAAAADRVLGWVSSGELDAARRSIRLDLVFLVLYGVTFTWWVTKARRHLAPTLDTWTADLGRFLRVGVVVGASLDLVEDLALLRFIDAVRLPSATAPPVPADAARLPVIARDAAVVKWVLLLSALLYALAGFNAWRRRRRIPPDPPRVDPPLEDWSRPRANVDLIMKGGITSGVIYPRLATRLATHYRFRAIGGTSVGAIAAAGTAAAEYRRAHGHLDGFEKLGQLPARLGSGLLLELFRPAARTRPVMDLFLAAMARRPALERFDGVVRAALRNHVVLAVAGTIAGLALGWLLLLPGPDVSLGLAFATAAVVALLASLPTGVVGAAQRLGVAYALHAAAAFATEAWQPTPLPLLVLTAAMVAGGLALLHRAAAPWPRVLVFLATGVLGTLHLVAGGEAFGAAPLTLGLTATLGAAATVVGGGAIRANRALTANGGGVLADHRAPDGETLTEWMTDLFDDIAFGGPRDGVERDRADRDGPAPLTFADLAAAPLRDPAGGITLRMMGSNLTTLTAWRLPFVEQAFAWRPEDLATRFTPRVLAHLDRHSTVADDGVTRVLTEPDQLPVVVAVRISLSFPVLFPPIALMTQRRDGRFVRTLWGDGGAASNLPVHFFDSVLPRWPTFAVDLRPAPRDVPDEAPPGDLVVLHEQRPDQARWVGGDGAATDTPLAGVISGFLGVATDWRDNVQLTAPGYWDRVVTVLQRSHEGGINLTMPTATIDALAARGETAADRLLERFAADGSTGWDEHRWTRYRVAMAEIQEWLDDLGARLDSGYLDLLRAPPGVFPLRSGRHAEKLARATGDLAAWSRKWLRDDALFVGFRAADAPHRSVELRVTPSS